ncbi:MAG: hypothetical protein GY811_22915 [Myxococcales bacterium]|nr:hypothetical protein [Myxococcales bacterium]
MPANSEIVLWAWHGAHDLRFLAKRSKADVPVSVAYLARRIAVGEEGLLVQLRSAPLHVPEGFPLTAVVRLEIASSLPADVLESALPELALHLSTAAAEEGVHILQIDFDAPARLRPQYRELLRDARTSLRGGQHLEMTALASWCLDDLWIDEGLVDGVVPMLFEMGPESAAIRSRLRKLARLPAPLCKDQVGVSTTDLMPPLLGARRVFVFAPGAWSARRLEMVEGALEAGHWTNK